MKKRLFLSEAMILQIFSDFESYFKNPESFIENLSKDDILYEKDVAAILKVCTKTLRKSRHENIFRYATMNGRIIYIRTFFWIDLIIWFLRENEKRRKK